MTVNHEMQNQILEEASVLFARYGVKGTTMMQLAGALRISKRTLYEYIPDKFSLLTDCVRRQITANLEEIRAGQESGCSLEKLFRMLASVHRQMTTPYPAFRREIAASRDTRQLLYDEYRTPLIGIARKYLAQAKRDGEIEQEVDEEMALALFEGLLFLAVSENSVAWSRKEVFLGAVKTCMAGISSDRGRELLNTLTKENSEE